ncbi:MAG: polysaccharide biosynthesis/export family protein [Gammaproteobacteria bacterium]|nr:polysaccharide biosynthesis/export family protein [Gammaproteobacteria bacterium]
MFSRFRALVWVFIAATGLVTPLAALGEEAPKAGPTAGAYGVNPGDILDISVWKEQDLQKQVIVRPDGYFSFPLAGDIRAAGRSIEEIRKDLAVVVGRFVPDPVVSVAILEPRGSKVYVIGQVNRPGEYPINRYVDVVQAISMASGFTPFAQLDNIRILRRQGATQTAIPFSYGDIAAGKRLQQNIVLEPGDTVLVP